MYVLHPTCVILGWCDSRSPRRESVSDISSPVGASVYLSPARKLIMMLFLVGGIIAAFSWRR